MPRIPLRDPVDVLRAATADDVLRFLVKFASMDGARVMEAEPALRQLLTVRFEGLGTDGWNARAATAVTDPPITRATMVRLQADVQRILVTIATMRPGGRPMPNAFGVWLPLRMFVTVQGAVGGPRTVRIMVSGSPRARLWFRVTRLIDEVGGDKLRQCECGILFIRHRRQEWHDEKCRAKHYMSKYREENLPRRTPRKRAAHGESTGTRRRIDSRTR